MVRRVGFIGVGLMGSAMTARLLDLGWHVGVRDIDPQREAGACALGAVAHRSPAALAAASDAIIVAVVDAAQTFEVLFGADGVTAALPAGRAVLLCPTIGPDDVERACEGLQARGIDCIDAPMSGGPVRARAGVMSLMVACPDAVFDRHRPLLQALANPVFHVSQRMGDGARTKLVNNLLAAINLAGAAEGLALAARMGLDPVLTLEIIGASSGQSWIAADRLARALAGDTAVRARVDLLAKDSALALAMASAQGVTLSQGPAAQAAFRYAIAAGCGAEDDAALYALALNSSPVRSESAP